MEQQVTKHSSVLMLFIRGSFYQFLLLLLAMAAAEAALFALALRDNAGYSLDVILQAARPQLPFAIAFMLLCALLGLSNCDFGSHRSYTLNRLRLAPRAVFRWQVASNAALLLIFWAAQVGIILAFCSVYTAQFPEPQVTMLVFYANKFLHSLFPLAEISRLLCNIALLAALAATAACVPYRLHQGEKPLALIVIAVMCLLFFQRQLGAVGSDIALAAISLLIAAYAVSGANSRPEPAPVKEFIKEGGNA